MIWDQDDSFLDEWSVGEDWAQVALDAGHRAAGLWESIVARDTGTLARSVSVTLELHKGQRHTSLYAVVSSTADYALPHEFGTKDHHIKPGHEWQQVLGMLGA